MGTELTRKSVFTACLHRYPDRNWDKITQEKVPKMLVRSKFTQELEPKPYMRSNFTQNQVPKIWVGLKFTQKLEPKIYKKI